MLSLRDRSDWQIRPRAKADVLSALGDYPPLVCQLLLNRGITDPQAASIFPGRAGFAQRANAAEGTAPAIQRMGGAREEGARRRVSRTTTWTG